MNYALLNIKCDVLLLFIAFEINGHSPVKHEHRKVVIFDPFSLVGEDSNRKDRNIPFFSDGI